MTEPAETPCPPAEALAALAEGRGPEGVRGAMVRHLRGCRGCFEAFSAALGSLDEQDEGAGRRWKPMAWLAAAAALVFGLWLWSPWPKPTGVRSAQDAPVRPLWELSRRMAATPLAPAEVGEVDAWPAGTPAGRAFTAEDVSRRWRRLGVRWADWEWARRFQTGSRAAAFGRLNAELAVVAPEVARSSSEETETPADLAERLTRAAGPSEALALGWLLEWCRLGAQAGRPEACPSLPEVAAAHPGAPMDDVERAAFNEAAARLQAVRTGASDEAGALSASLKHLLEILT